MGYGVPDDAMGYGLPPRHIGKSVLTPRKGTSMAEHPHEPPRPQKNYGVSINTLIELLDSGRLLAFKQSSDTKKKPGRLDRTWLFCGHSPLINEFPASAVFRERRTSFAESIGGQ